MEADTKQEVGPQSNEKIDFDSLPYWRVNVRLWQIVYELRRYNWSIDKLWEWVARLQ